MSVDIHAIEALTQKTAEQAAEAAFDIQEAKKAAAKRMIDADKEIELVLEEVAPEPIKVSFTEWKEEPVLIDGEPLLIDGKPDVRLIPRTRIAQINTVVPVEIFVRVMALRKKMGILQKVEGQEEEAMKLFAQCVLDVWRLTEPNMSLDRLMRGLKIEQIRGLFAHFFSNLSA